MVLFLQYRLNGKNWSNFFCFFANAKQHKARELDMITFRNHAPRSYMTWLPVTLTWLLVTLTWLLYNLQVLTSRALISKIHCRLSANQKRVRELNVPITSEEIVIFMIKGVIARVISKSDEREARGRFENTSTITPWIVRHEVQLLINHIYNKFWAKTSVTLILSFENCRKLCSGSH